MTGGMQKMRVVAYSDARAGFIVKKAGHDRVALLFSCRVQDVFLGGVVRAEVAPCVRRFVHDVLEQRAENRRGNAAPVDRAALQQRGAHVAVEAGERQTFLEQFAIDVRKPAQRVVEVFQPRGFRRVEHVEQLCQLRREIAAVLARLLLDEFGELRALENAGVLGEQAKQQAHQIDFERVAGVADLLQAVVQPRHALYRLGVDRALRRDFLRLITGDEPEQFDVFVQLFQQEFGLRAFDHVVQAEARKVADQHETRQFVFLQSGEIVDGLLVGAIEIFTARFVLNQQVAFPQPVNVTVAVAEFFDLLLETADAPLVDAKDLEEFDPERFCVGVFRFRFGLVAGKRQRAVFDFVPG